MQSPGFQSNVRNIGSPLMQQQFGVQPPQFNAQAPQMGGQFGSYIQQLQKQIGGLGNQIQAMNQRQGQPAAQPEPQPKAEPATGMSLLDELKERYLTMGPFQSKAKFGTREYGDARGAYMNEMWGPGGNDWKALGQEGQLEFQDWQKEQQKQISKSPTANQTWKQTANAYGNRSRQMANSYINKQKSLMAKTQQKNY